MQQLEQEVKLEIGPDWLLPDLSGVLPGVRAHPMPDVALETTYFDTADLHLSRRHVSLRFRRETELVPPSRRRGTGPVPQGRTSEEWTVKLPSTSDGILLTRTEVTWTSATTEPKGAPGKAAGQAGSRRAPATAGRSSQSSVEHPRAVHPEAAELVQAIALGQPLLGVAHLVTTRQRTELRTSDGRRLAEIDHDSVHGTVLPGIEERSLRNAAGREVHFSEVEVELAEGSSLEILHAVVEKLEGCGARASTGGSKLTAVLQLPERATAPAKRRQVPLMADVLQEQARSCLDALLGHDPAIRIGDSDPEHIHRARVATRRLRTVLRAFAPVLSAVPPDGPPPWLSEMSEDLKWFAGTLGAARDSDVRLGSLEIDCAALPSLDAPGGATLLRAARDQQAGSHAELLDAMTKDRYLHLLQALEALASGVGPGLGDVPIMFWPTLCRPAATVMPSLAEQQWRAVLKAVENLGDQPADDQLHRVRIRAKGLRYVAEVAAPVLRRPADCRAAKATARAATDLQDVLGELHDAVATEQWLREAAEAAARQPGRAKGDALVVTGVAAGQLIAAAQDRQRAQRSAWPAVWDRLDRKKLLNWMA